MVVRVEVLRGRHMLYGNCGNKRLNYIWCLHIYLYNTYTAIDHLSVDIIPHKKKIYEKIIFTYICKAGVESGLTTTSFRSTFPSVASIPFITSSKIPSWLSILHTYKEVDKGQSFIVMFTCADFLGMYIE